MLVPVLPVSSTGLLCPNSFYISSVMPKFLVPRLPCHMLIQPLSLRLVMLVLQLKVGVGVLAKAGMRVVTVLVQPKWEVHPGPLFHRISFFQSSVFTRLRYQLWPVLSHNSSCKGRIGDPSLSIINGKHDGARGIDWSYYDNGYWYHFKSV